MLDSRFPDDSFGDRFELDRLPLPRAASGYAVQMLATDQLLDRNSGLFLPIRSAELDGLFASFEAAYLAARTWVENYCPAPEEHRLAIVPASFDSTLKRHVLIYGVLGAHP